MFKCRTFLSNVESTCEFQDVKRFCCFGELFCNIVEETRRFVKLLPRIVILSIECPKQMFYCLKAFDKRCTYSDKRTTKEGVQKKNFFEQGYLFNTSRLK